MNLVGIRSKLKRPYYFEESFPKRILSSFFFGLFVFLFLFLFQPFGLNLAANVLELSLGYGLCCFLVMLLLYALLPLALPAVFIEENWKIRNEILWIMLIVGTIGIANAVYSVYMGISPSGFRTFIVYGFYTVLIGIFPVAMSVFMNEKRLSGKFSQSSALLNSGLEAEHSTQVSELLIPSENKNEELRLKSSQLLFIRSSDNYAEVFYWDGNALQKKLLRSSLKNISDKLASELM